MGETISLLMTRVARVARVAMGITTSYKKQFRVEYISWTVQEIFMSTGRPSWQWVFIVLAILLSKWAIQHNWCRVCKICRKGSKTKYDKKTEKGGSDIEMQNWGKSGRQFNNDRHDIVETHNLMPRLNDRQTVFSKQTADSQTDIQTAKQSAVVPLQLADMESRLREGLFPPFL